MLAAVTVAPTSRTRCRILHRRRWVRSGGRPFLCTGCGRFSLWGRL